MTTIVNTPPQNQDSGGGTGMIVGAIILVVLVFIFFVYGLPVIRGATAPQINVPSKVDVNISGQK